MTHLTPNVWGLFYTNNQFSNSVVSSCPTVYPILTLIPRISIDPIGLRAQSYKTVLTSDSSHKYWVLRVPILLSNLAIISGISTIAFFFSALVIC